MTKNGSNWQGPSAGQWLGRNMQKTMGDQMKPKQRTAALYARFSSDLQKDRSVDDQFADCERFAKREGLKIVAKFSDRAKSGSTLFGRDGALELMLAAKARKFD